MDKEFKNKVTSSVNLEKEEEDALDEIRWREHKSKSKIMRLAIQEYINAHSAGNDTYKLDNWEDPNFKAVPSIMDKDMKKWKDHFFSLNPQEFFYLLKIINERRNQMLEIKRMRGLSLRNA